MATSTTTNPVLMESLESPSGPVLHRDKRRRLGSPVWSGSDDSQRTDDDDYGDDDDDAAARNTTTMTTTAAPVAAVAAKEKELTYEEIIVCLNKLHDAMGTPPPPEDECHKEVFKECCERLNNAFGEMEDDLSKEDLSKGDITEDEKIYNAKQKDPIIELCKGEQGGGGVNQMGGAFHIPGRIFSIRRPSIRKFLMILLCCLKNVAETCKFAADIVKLILAILTIGATIGVSSFILYYLAAAIQALGCAGWSAISGATADLCSCAVGATAAGVIAGPSAAQFGMIVLGTTAAVGGVVASNRDRFQRIRELVRAGARGRREAADAAGRRREAAAAEQINSLLNQGPYSVLFNEDGLLRTYGKRVLDYLCDETFRENVNAYLQTGVPSDLALLIHEISIIMSLAEGTTRPGGLIGTGPGSSTADLETLNILIQEAAGGGQATIAQQMNQLSADIGTALDAFSSRNFSAETWTTAVSPMTKFVMNLVNNIRRAPDAGANYFGQVREFLGPTLARLRPRRARAGPNEAAARAEVDSIRDEEMIALLLGLASSLPPESVPAMGLSPVDDPADSDGGGYPTRRRRRTKRRSKSKRRTKSRRRRTLRKTSKRTRKTNVRRKFTRKSTKKLSRRRSRKLSRKSK